MKLGVPVGEGRGYFVYGSMAMLTSGFKVHNPANIDHICFRSGLGFSVRR